MRRIELKELKEFFKCLPSILKDKLKETFNSTKKTFKGFFNPSGLTIFFLFTTVALYWYKDWTKITISAGLLVLSLLWKYYEEGLDRHIRKQKGEL